MPSDKPMLHIVMEVGLLARIDDYRYANRIASRSEAVRRLIEQALKQSEK
jgi:metal-responsive CopG/Arc/MetJ family transcriptional regulator